MQIIKRVRYYINTVINIKNKLIFIYIVRKFDKANTALVAKIRGTSINIT